MNLDFQRHFKYYTRECVLSVINKHKNGNSLWRSMQLQKHVSVASHSHRRLDSRWCAADTQSAAGCTGNNVSAIKWLCPSILVRLDSPSESHGDSRRRDGIGNLIRETCFITSNLLVALQFLKINVRPLPRSWEIDQTQRNFYRGKVQGDYGEI